MGGQQDSEEDRESGIFLESNDNYCFREKTPHGFDTRKSALHLVCWIDEIQTKRISTARPGKDGVMDQ